MKKLITIFAIITFISCSSEKYELITGEWKCEKWIVEKSGKDNCKNNVFFSFNADKTYQSTIGNLNQIGKFEILGSQLICYPEGSLKIGVGLNKLTKDTLDFTMSRSGQKEIITLVRK